MRISDWSSDVCSSDLLLPAAGGLLTIPAAGINGVGTAVAALTAVWAGVWGLDYSLNAMDSAFRRPSFERDLRRLVTDVRIEASGLARRQATAVTCAAFGEPSRSDRKSTRLNPSH